MKSTQPNQAVSSTALWTGRVLTGIIVLFMAFDAGVKLLKLPAAVEGTVRLGYPADQVVPLGIVVLICVALYAIPQTAVLGAILLTGYLGGATATQARVESALFVLPVLFGVLVWGGLYFRDPRVRALLPFSK